MGSIESEMVQAAPMARPAPTKLFSGKLRRQAIVKLLSKMSQSNYSQWTLLMVDSKGKATIDTSDAFRNYKDDWFPENLIKKATAITASVAAQMREQKRREGEQAGEQLKEDAAEDEAAIEDIDDFDDDAEHEEDEGSKDDQNLTKNSSQLSPQFPGYSLSPTTPIARKRSLTAVKITPSQKKRRRSLSLKTPQSAQVPDPSSGDSNTQGITYRPLLISDEQAVTTFFETRFRQMQQLTCKVVAKAWIKVIEPKKQSNFPYNRGEESKPSWWPAGARHKEPDHLMKPERLLLLMTMLRCRKVPVAKLEVATSEVAAHIEECRIGLLEEIYRVARMEERWIAGTLPPDARCYVAASADKIVSNQKPPSPKVVEDPVSSPSAPIPGQPGSSLGAGTSANPGCPDSRSNNLDVSVRPTPSLNPADAIVPRNQSNPFSAPQAVPTTVQPLHTPISFNTASFMSSAQVHEEPYMQPLNPYSYNRQMYTAPGSTPRRSQAIPAVPHQSFGQWSPVSTVQVGGELFSPYNANTQTHPASHNYPSHPHHAASQAPTPVSAATSPYQTMQLPPPLPSIHHQQPQTALGPPSQHDMAQQYDATQRIAPHLSGHHPNVSFSEFLESPIPDRAYELGSVAEGGVSVEVGIEVTRTEDSTGRHSVSK